MTSQKCNITKHEDVLSDYLLIQNCISVTVHSFRKFFPTKHVTLISICKNNFSELPPKVNMYIKQQKAFNRK